MFFSGNPERFVSLNVKADVPRPSELRVGSSCTFWWGRTLKIQEEEAPSNDHRSML